MNKNKGNKLYEEMDLYTEQQKELKQEIFQQIVLNAIYGLRLPQPIKHCFKKINLSKLPNFSEKIIGQVLGKGGIHKHEFTEITGVNLEIDKDCEHCVILSKYHPADVEKARMLIMRLLKKSNWSQEHMQKQYEEVKAEFKVECIDAGSQILKEYLKYEEFSDRLAEIVGLLRYSYSYNQNMLDHCLEVAQLCANVAAQISLNPLMAKRAGFFHDIGKSTANYDDHVRVGMAIAESEDLELYIQNAIESHHGKVKTNNPYSVLVKSMDKVSAGRVAARPFQFELIKKRVDSMNADLMKLDWIEKVVLRNAGNLIQVFIKLHEFSVEKIPEMKQQIVATLTSNDTYQYNYEIELKLFYNECFLFNDVPKNAVEEKDKGLVIDHTEPFVLTTNKPEIDEDGMEKDVGNIADKHEGGDAEESTNKPCTKPSKKPKTWKSKSKKPISTNLSTPEKDGKAIVSNSSENTNEDLTHASTENTSEKEEHKVLKRFKKPRSTKVYNKHKTNMQKKPHFAHKNQPTDTTPITSKLKQKVVEEVRHGNEFFE